MDVVQLIDTLDADHLLPAYLLHGKERFVIERAIMLLKKLVLSGPMSSFNLHELSGKETSGDAVVNRAAQIPMMATKSLVIVDDAHKMSADDYRVIDAYLEDPSPLAVLVMVAESFNAGRKLTKTAKKKGWLFEAAPLKEQGIVPFLRWRAKERSVDLSREAAAAVAAVVGPDCAALDDAVERLGLFVGGGRAVNEEDVSEVVTAIRQHSIFELVDAIGSGRDDRAFALLENLLKQQEEPILINAMIARHFRQLLKTRIHLFLKTDESAFAGLVGAPPFMVKKLIAQARRFRGASLENALNRLARADLELKSVKRSGALVVEEAVMDLLSRSAS
jgi:DNA polymerase-3 subunit delta